MRRSPVQVDRGPAVEIDHFGECGATAAWRARAFTPTPSSELRLNRESSTLGVGPNPWAGRMLVVTDAGSGSSGESSTLYLRDGLGARVIGAPSRA